MKLVFVRLFVGLATMLVASSSTTSYEPKMIDRIDVKYPGYVSFVPSTNNRSYHLAITAFNGAPFSADHIFYLPDYTGSSQTRPMVELNHTNVVWPNEATFTSESILSEQIDKFGGLLVASGFLVPSKENGGIFYYPFSSADRSTVTNQPPIEFSSRSQSSTTWFYHR